MTVCTVLLICNLVFIWGNSLLPAEVSGQISGSISSSHPGHLLAVYLYTALFHQTACLLLGGSQLALHHQIQNADGAVGQVLGGQLGGGHVAHVAAAHE
mgnify:CR=1 FL=1